jgi:ribosomal RNA assembly protein
LSFSQVVRVPRERVAVVIGRGGETKKKLEESFGVKLTIDSESGDVAVRTDPSRNLLETDPFKAVEIIDAIGKGFSPTRCLRLMEDEMFLSVVDLREFVGKSRNSLERVKGRIIGENGKARKVLEELSGAYISVYGHTVATIGTKEQNKMAKRAVEELALGSEHKVVYSKLQRERAKAKLERLKLWED